MHHTSSAFCMQKENSQAIPRSHCTTLKFQANREIQEHAKLLDTTIKQEQESNKITRRQLNSSKKLLILEIMFSLRKF